MRGRLDAIDWKILRELQDDGRMTNVELARRVGISAPPCLRRVRALEEAGIITGYRALLNAKILGQEVMAFAMVGLTSQAEADLAAFTKRVENWPIVRESYMLSGEVDFLLKCIAPDLGTFQSFVIDEPDGGGQCRQRAHHAHHPAEQERAAGADRDLMPAGFTGTVRGRCPRVAGTHATPAAYLKTTFSIS